MSDNTDVKLAPELWCHVCHTRWTELVFSPGQKCPFVDCIGILSTHEPHECAELRAKERARRAARKQDRKSTPLFDGGTR